jgi:alkyldihydroxyacetonephosphate synthase
MKFTGGWVATRSSGMKQQTYGNIEDIVEKITLVTSIGVLEKDFLAPRVSIGPDFHQIVLGSEGSLGVITKVVVKVHNKPEIRRFGSIVFPDFEHGVKFMHEVSKWPLKPSSLRLVDNDHIQAGIAYESHATYFAEWKGRIKTNFLRLFYGYDIKKVSLATYLIENTKDEVDKIETKLKKFAGVYKGVLGGPEFGRRSYLLTHVICYSRVGKFIIL